MEELFFQDERLGIPVPNFLQDWDELSEDTQHSLLFQWEKVRGTIPDRITELEMVINVKQAELADESDFEQCCQLNDEIAELASIINDLWIWYRTHHEIPNRMFH